MEEALTPHQEQVVAALFATLDTPRRALPSIVISGPPGTGKRTIVQQAAKRLGIPFIEVRLDVPRVDVIATLCGSIDGDDANPDTSERDLGVLGAPGPLLLYLSHLENLDASLIHFLANLLASRLFLLEGNPSIRNVNDEIWLICGLTLARTLRIDASHWLLTRFDARLRVNAPTLEEEFQQIAQNCADRCSRSQLDAQLGTTLLKMSPPDNFHAVQRWISSACIKANSEVLSPADVFAASVEDLSWAIRRVEYRGTRLELRHVEDWLKQIDEELRPLGVHLVRQLAENYFMSADEYFGALSKLSEFASITSREHVSFCKWQPIGKSAPHLSHDLKNQGRWKIVEDIDLYLPETWQVFEGAPVFVLVDDFVGTGRTLKSLVSSGDTSQIVKLSRTYPRSRFVLLFLVAFEDPASEVFRELRTLLGDRVSLHIFRTLNDGDRCFTTTSRVVENGDQRSIKNICITARKRHFPSLPKRFMFGFEHTGAFFAFFNSVPNNSLPILWHDTSSWYPLLPASKRLA